MENQNVRLNTYKEFVNKGFWTLEQLEAMKDVGTVTEEEYKAIVNQPKVFADTRIDKQDHYYKLWDKKTPINGVPAEEILKDPTFARAKGIFTIHNPATGDIERMESVNIIKNNNRLRADMTDDEVAQFYLDQMKQIENTPEVNPAVAESAATVFSTSMRDAFIRELYDEIKSTNEKLDKIVKLLSKDNTPAPTPTPTPSGGGVVNPLVQEKQQVKDQRDQSQSANRTTTTSSNNNTNKTTETISTKKKPTAFWKP